MKPFFPGGRQGTGTHGGPQYGKHYPHHSTPTPAPSPSNPNTPLSKIGAANAEITRGNIKAGVAILEEAAFEGAQAGSQDIGAQVLTTRLIMAYEEHGVIEQDGKTGGITVSRQERAFTIATHAKAVAEALAAKEKKTGSLPVILTAALRGKTTKDFAAIAVKQENAILAVTTVPDPIPAPATTTTPKPVEPVRTASTPAPTPTPSPVPQPIRVTEAGVAPTQDDTNSRAAALLEQAETADREGQEARRSDILRTRFAPLVASVTDQELLTRARRLIRRTGDVIPELAPPAAQPITVTVAGVGTPIPVPPPPPPVPEPPKAPAIDPALQARIDPFLRSGKGRLASKDYLGAIIAFKQILAVVPDHLEARAGLNACAAGILVNAERAYSSGQEKGAITILRKQFMSAEPTDPEILLRARALAERLGETIPGLTLEKPIKPSDPEPAKPAAPAGPVIDRELDLLRAAVTANQQDLMALNNLARALTERKAFDEAKAVLARAQAISLDSKETLLTAIILYGKAGMARERLYAIVLFLNQEQGNLYVLTQLGFYFLQTGDNLHARGAFEHVLDCKPDHESARIGLAQLRGPRPSNCKGPAHCANLGSGRKRSKSTTIITCCQRSFGTRKRRRVNGKISGSKRA
ncbi:MAG: tetratricopeptide repeat protein [Candidatus Saganbacteria bacterium]|nr:tetratricopeptide repeat protein [Candidatus Saganbacteria bacterium]